MKRIAPLALLALAAIVVLPAQTTSTTPPGLSRIPAGIDRGVPGFGPGAAYPGRLDAGRIGWPERSLHDNPLVASAPVIVPASRDEPRTSPRPSVPGSVPHAGEAPGASGGTTPRSGASAARSPVTPAGESTILAWVTPTGFQVVIGKDAATRRVYVGLIEPADLAREEHCLAQAVYFEARSEAEDGRAAIAQVVLNRVKSGVYPGTVCGVVFQNRHRKLACQFTFACEGKALRITEPEAWKAAQRIARDVYEGKIYLAELGAATHYHADYVQPSWAKKLRKMDVIGRHVFYS